MKKISFFLSLVVLILFSCDQNSDQSVQPTAAPRTLASKRDLSGARTPPTTLYPITINGSGEYVSGYGGGITFGTSMPHITTVDGTGFTDGEPDGGFDYVSPSAESAPFHINGAYFAIVIPDNPAQPPSEADLEDFYALLDDIWLDGGGRRAAPGNARTQSGGDETINGGSVISGQVVRDHSSPTNASVTTDDYVYDGDDGPPCTPLCATTKSHISFTFFVTDLDAASGTICNVFAENAQLQSLVIAGFNLTYSGQNGTTVHVTGSVTIGTTIYHFNDTLNVAQI